jgi:hypothetical protein
MPRQWSKPQRRLLTIVVLSVAVVVADIVAVNIAGEVPEAWWVLAVPVGFLVVPTIGIVCLVRLLGERRHT